MQSLQAFLNANKVRFSADWADENPHLNGMPAGSSHYKCTIKSGSRQMTVFFSQGPAVCREPTAKSVLSCLAMDASGYENAGSFEDWCAEYGYDTDSRRAEKTYRAIEKQSADLLRVFGDAQYKKLLWDTEQE